MLFQLAHDVGDSRCFLTDSHIHAGHVLTLLIDDGIHRNSGLAGLAVADDQLPLTATDRHHGVNRFQAGLYRLINRFTRYHARRNFFNLVGHLGVNRTLAVYRLAQRIHHTSAQFRSNRNFKNTSGTFDRVAFSNMLIFTEHHRADRISLEVQCKAKSITGEFQHFTLHYIGKPVYTDNAVSDTDYGTFGSRLCQSLKVFDATTNQITNFGRVELHL